MYAPMACTTTRVGHREDLMWSWKDIFNIDNDGHVFNFGKKNITFLNGSGSTRSAQNICTINYYVRASIRPKSTKWVRTHMN